MKPVYLDKHDLPPSLQYLGKAVLYLAEDVTLHADEGTWRGGTRIVSSAVELATGKTVPITDTFSAPWDPIRKDRRVKLKPGFAILQTGDFCGKRATPTLYVHPQDTALALPAPPPDLSFADKVVLEVTCSLKSAYRAAEYERYGLASHQVSEAKHRLQGLGLLDSRGAVTTKGRNARQPIPRT